MQHPHLKKGSAQLLGNGSYGIVYQGQHNGENVAIKRIELSRIGGSITNPTEDQNMKLCDHLNVLKVLDVDQDDDFKYIVLELCVTTLHHYIKENLTEDIELMPSEPDALYQMACGLKHIHEKGLVHRDISAQNVLIQRSNDLSTVLKISDFGFCKPATERGSFSVSRNGTGTVHFIAPELLTMGDDLGDDNPRGTIACDVFSLGCVFYRFLTMGKHPFSTGDDLAININIRAGNHNLDGLTEDHFARRIVKKIIQREPINRFKIAEVVEALHKVNTISY